MNSIDVTDLKSCLGKTFACPCGKDHTVPVQEIVYDTDALHQMPEICRKYVKGNSVIVIADERTWQIAGERAYQELEKTNWRVGKYIVPDVDQDYPVCNDITRDMLFADLPKADFFLAVGSGVINDLTKWIAFDRNIPYAVVATAASMNGYAAAIVATCIKGVKGLFFARSPFAVFAEPQVIVEAPFELTAAGFGDQMAKPISTADWVMNHFLFDEFFCPTCSEMITHLETQYMAHPESIKVRDPEAIQALFDSLLYSGIAMTLAGSSAPASGGEHMLSHTLDMISQIQGIPHDLHGKQVGLGCIFTAALYEKILGIKAPTWRSLPAEIDRDFWGTLADAIAHEYAQKQQSLQVMQDKLSDVHTWQLFLDQLKPRLRSPQQIKEALQAAGAAHCLADLTYSAEQVLAALQHQHEIRKRVTVIDLAWSLGLLRGMIDDIVRSWF
jgi:glycerol-1-phosphate dehydrogenase [NAD(P)+]